MPGSTNFSNVLPEPTNLVNDAGQPVATGSAPGFSSIKIKSEAKTMNERSNSGRYLAKSIAGHKWTVDISYNPLTRDEFEPVYSFLLQKKGRLTPFFLSLPQNKLPRNGTFATAVKPASAGGSAKELKTYSSPLNRSQLVKGRRYKIMVVGSGTTGAWASVGATNPQVNAEFTATGNGSDSGGGTAAPVDYIRGVDNIVASFNSYSISTHGTPKPGDFFTVTDTNDTLHQKLYKVTRVETATDFQDAITAPGATSNPAFTGSPAGIRIHFAPNLQRNLSVDSTLNFYDPKMRVVMNEDVQEYSLNTQNLYSFSLKLEEAQK